MTTSGETLFQAFLNLTDQEKWSEILETLWPLTHEVDRAPAEIWFHFYPLGLSRAWEAADDPDQLARDLLLVGDYRLKNQIDSSHRFLYGHRYWPEVKRTVEEHAGSHAPSANLELTHQILALAGEVAKRCKVELPILVGITAIAFMTLQQVGLAAFRGAPGAIRIDPRAAARSPERVLKARARNPSPGLTGFLKGDAREYTVTFNENKEDARFKLVNTQHLTTAAANDKRPYHLTEPRCTPNEGPIPVQCRSAACGSCWVGILGGAEKLSEVASLERERIKEFGYIDTDDSRPRIRLACQAQAFGAVSIVIPPWNGVFGRYLRSGASPKLNP